MIIHFSDLFDIRYFSADVLAERLEATGLDALPRTIKSMEKRDVGQTDGEPQVKPVITFEEDGPEFICNITNGRILLAEVGRPEKWVGAIIELHLIKDQAPSGMRDCVRVRAAKQKKAKFAAAN